MAGANGKMHIEKGELRKKKKKMYIYVGSLCFGISVVSSLYVFSYINIYIYIYIYIDRESASRFSRGTVLNTLKQSGINILRGKKDTTTFSLGKCSCVLFSS